MGSFLNVRRVSDDSHSVLQKICECVTQRRGHGDPDRSHVVLILVQIKHSCYLIPVIALQIVWFNKAQSPTLWEYPDVYLKHHVYIPNAQDSERLSLMPYTPASALINGCGVVYYQYEVKLILPPHKHLFNIVYLVLARVWGLMSCAGLYIERLR